MTRVIAWSAAAATFVCLMAGTWIGHSDPGDAQVYEVVARHLAQDGQWLSLRYLPTIHPHFYEHLPFSFWVMALVIRALGEGALAPVFGLFSLGVVLLTGATARRLAGDWAGIAAVVVLGTTMHFFKDAGHPLLDPLLLLLATGGAAPVLLGQPTTRGWLVAFLLTAAAVAVKGPFGLLPLAGAVVARAALDRSANLLLLGASVALAAVLPTAALLLARADWWKGYFVDQVLASATGERTDGVLSRPLYPFEVFAGRFWPGMLFLPLGVVAAAARPRAWVAWLCPDEARRAEYQRAAHLLAIQGAFILLALCLPGRKVWHHTLIAYPTFAAWAGVAVGPRLDRAFASPRASRWAAAGLVGLACAALAASVGGVYRLYLHAPCVVSQELSAPLRAIPEGAPVLVVSDDDEWDFISALAAETALVPWKVAVLDAAASQPPAGTALVTEKRWSNGHPGWREVARARGWILASAEK